MTGRHHMPGSEDHRGTVLSTLHYIIIILSGHRKIVKVFDYLVLSKMFWVQVKQWLFCDFASWHFILMCLYLLTHVCIHRALQ